MQYKAIVVADVWDDGTIKEVILVPEGNARSVVTELNEMLTRREQKEGALQASAHDVVVCKSVKDLKKKPRFSIDK